MLKKKFFYPLIFLLTAYSTKSYIFGSELPTKDDLKLELRTLIYSDKLLYPTYEKNKNVHILQEDFKTYLKNNLFTITENQTMDDLISISKVKPTFVYNILDENNNIFSWYGTKYRGLLDKNIFLVYDKINTDVVLLDSNKNQIWIDEKLFLTAWKNSNNSLLYLDKVLMDVPSYSQLKLGYPTGCEFVALGMMVNYKLQDGVTINDISSSSPRNINPNYGYRGDPRSNGGFSVFPSALLDLTINYLGNGIDLTGKSLVDLKRHLSLNTPIVIWVNGLGFNVHAITLSGYDENGFYYNDPYRGTKDMFISYEKFYKIWDKPIYDEILNIYYEPRKALTY